MDQKNVSRSVIIVGGGLAGLTAACYLARAGVAVTLFEQAAQLGGSAATQQHAGYAFNRGLHALYPGGAATDVLRELGVAYEHGAPPDVSVLHRGALHAFPVGPLALLRSRLLSVGDKLDLVRLFAALPRLTPHTLAQQSVADWITRVLRRPQPRALLAAVARTFVYSAALDLVSAEVFVEKLQRVQRHPVQYLDGGWGTLVDGLRRAATQAGAQIVQNTRADAIAHDKRWAVGVRLRDGGVLPAEAVILAVRPPDALRLLDEGAAPALHRAVAQLVPAQIACLDVALRSLPDARHPVVQDLDGPRFLSAQSCYARVAPDGGAFIGAFKQGDPRQPADPQADARDLEALLDATQPGWRAVLVKRVFMPNITACGALPMASSGGFAGRPTAQAAGVANLFLAGDWIGPEGFLADASFASARHAARLALASEKRGAQAVRALDTEIVYG